jgi:3-deoxy-D-manno-octulosonic-acid transferase
VRNALNLNDNDFVITAGCAHAGEGKILRHCFDQLKEFNSNCKMIVIPRYLDEVPVLMEETGNIAIHLNEISTHQEWDMCIVGKLGILDDMYKIADSAIVCGTFTDIGGHNVWDAARFGIPVFFGPDYRTQTDSCETLITAGVGFSVSNGDHLAEKIFTVMKTDAKNFVSSQVAFIDKVNKSQSALEPLIP